MDYVVCRPKQFASADYCMKRGDLLRHLRLNGCILKREGLALDLVQPRDREAGGSTAPR
jgi:hypothetical protein